MWVHEKAMIDTNDVNTEEQTQKDIDNELKTLMERLVRWDDAYYHAKDLLEKSEEECVKTRKEIDAVNMKKKLLFKKIKKIEQ